MQRLIVLGLNHSTAPLPVREKLAFNATQRDEALAAFKQRFPDAEAVLVSTCNRVELYAARAVDASPRLEELVEFVASLRQIPVNTFSEHLYHKSERSMVEHLFTVTSSLDSMVIGETQILGQVRDAYEAAVGAGAVAAKLHPIFQRALAVGKDVMTGTAIGEGRVSVASVAVDYAGRIFDHFGDKTVLSIGAGKMAALVLQSFAALKPKRLLVCNRDPAKAEKLAQRFAGTAVPFEDLNAHLAVADVVISSTGAAQPIITRSQYEFVLPRRRYRPAFLIDIALPRDIEPSIGDFENVYLYNLDDLQQVVSATQSQRRDAIDAARQIVTKHVEQFVSWHRAREMGPFIERLSQRYHTLAKEEVERTINKLGRDVTDVERQHLEELSRRIVNKLLHDPIKALRATDTPHGASAGTFGPTGYLHAIEKLFQLGDDAENAADEQNQD